MSAKYLVALLPLLAPLVSAETATFTHYGSGDSTGSQNCANPPADRPLACGAGTTNVKGYTAAISQNVYGAGPGAGAGPGCGECWTLTIDQDENGNPITQKTINVTINNLCPAQGNEEWCDIPAGGTNQHGGQVHFDICSDNGGEQAFFTSTGAGKGTATQIQCGSGTAAESSSSAAPSTAQPTSPASSAPASSAPASSAYSASTASAASGSQGSSPPESSSGGSPYQGGSPSSGAGGAQGTSAGSPPQGGGKGGKPPYQPSLHSHPAPSFSFPGSRHTPHPHSPHSPHVTPTPGAEHHHRPGFPGGPWGHGGPGPYKPGSNSVSAAAAQSSDECPEEEKKKAHKGGYKL